MNRSHFFAFAAILVAALTAPVSSAQTPANIVVTMGSGQLVCTTGCTNAPPPTFVGQLNVIVTDANNNPIPNYPVTWNVVSGPLFLNGQASFSTNTLGDGSSAVIPFFNLGIVNSGSYAQGQVSITAGTITNFVTLTDAIPCTNAFCGNTSFSQTGPTQQVLVDFSQMPAGFSGTAGGTGTPFQVTVYTVQRSGVPGVSIRLMNDDGTSGPDPNQPSVYCQTGPTGSYGTPDPYSVLTDATGTATCAPVFGPVPGGTHSVIVVVGGIPAGIWSNGTNIPGVAAGTLYNPNGATYSTTSFPPLSQGYQLSGNLAMNIQPAAIGSVTATSGNGQSANPGQSLANPLVVTVKNTSGNPLAGQTVTWTSSPLNAVSLGTPSSVTNTSGQASTTVTFASGASGTVTITATIGGKTAAFTETAIPPIVVSSLNKIAGDSQSAVVGNAFATPLTVQLGVSSGSASGVPVAFTTSGAAVTLSASSATTNSSGIAQVTATAGATPGNATVTATVGSTSVTFSLVVVPQGPSLTASNFVNGADLQKGSISPCSLAAIAAIGVAPAVSGTLTGPLVGPLPYTLGGITVTFNANDPAPIVSVSSNQITFEVPCDLSAGSVPVTVNLSGATSTVNVNLQGAGPGVFSSVQSDGSSRAVVLRPDGSFATPSNPARRGENVTVFVTGLGASSPAVSTNAVPIPGTPSIPTGTIIVGINGAGVLVNSYQLTPDRQGIGEINFQIPTDAPQGNNVSLAIGVIPAGSTTEYFSGGAAMPIQ